jgi:hypothetical protein
MPQLLLIQLLRLCKLLMCWIKKIWILKNECQEQIQNNILIVHLIYTGHTVQINLKPLDCNQDWSGNKSRSICMDGKLTYYMCSPKVLSVKKHVKNFDLSENQSGTIWIIKKMRLFSISWVKQCCIPNISSLGCLKQIEVVFHITKLRLSFI